MGFTDAYEPEFPVYHAVSSTGTAPQEVTQQADSGLDMHQIAGKAKLASDQDQTFAGPVDQHQWVVVGGVDKGGIIVRQSSETSSQQTGRLEHGAVVHEKERKGDRLHYERLTGNGPKSGWVSLKYK